MRLKHCRCYWQKGLRRLLSAAILASLAQLAFAESEYADGWGPSIGSMAPLLSAHDQDGKQRQLDTLTGSNGLLFIFNRSVDW